jgi:hypothetical protein
MDRLIERARNTIFRLEYGNSDYNKLLDALTSVRLADFDLA